MASSAPPDTGLPTGAPVAPTPARAKARQTLGSLQVLRGLAAAYVVVLHVAMFIRGATGRNPFPDAMWQGYSGVDVFFCLSGFIIYHAHVADLGRRDRVAPFALRRVIRIYPTYWVICLVVVALSFRFPHIATTGVPSPLYAIKSALLVPQSQGPMLPPAWTLVHEMRFYMGFGLLMLAPRRWFLPLMGVAAVGGVVVLNLVELAPQLLTSRLAKVMLFVFHPSNAEFTLGVFASAFYSTRRTTAWFDVSVLALGVASFVFAVAHGNYLSDAGFRYFAIATYAVPAFLLVFGAILVERRWHAEMPLALTRLGDASYSIYLAHWPVLAVLITLLTRAGVPLLTQAIVGFICGIAGGFLLWALVERPTLQRFRRLTRPTTPHPSAAEGRPALVA